MPTITASTVIDAPPEDVFDYAADYRHATSLVPGLTRFAPEGEETSGLGATFSALMELGPAHYEMTLAVNVFDRPSAIGWQTTSGLTQSLLWSFAPDGDGTKVDFELGVELPGGISGNLLSMTLEPVLRSRAKETAAALKSQVEAEGADVGAPSEQ